MCRISCQSGAFSSTQRVKCRCFTCAAAEYANRIDRLCARRKGPGTAALLGRPAEDNVLVSKQQRLAADFVGGGDGLGLLPGIIRI